jgi:hypothetical protein
VVAAALQGLDGDRDAGLPAAAVPFLADPSPAVRRAAARQSPVTQPTTTPSAS